MNKDYFLENEKVAPILPKNRSSVSISTLIISIITTVVFVFIVVNKWPDVMSLVGIDANQKENISIQGLNVGDDVNFTGIIKNDGDIVNYTHTINSLDIGEFGLKSSKINLNNYADEVYIEGIVEKIYQGTPIISVYTIYSLDLQDEILEEDGLSGLDYDSKYLSNIGIYLDSDFFQKYSLLNDGDGSVLKIKNSNTNEIINLNYFKCSKTNNNQNCERFNEMFSTASAQKFVDTYSITYYKQTDVQSWFFSNDLLFGYFINDSEDVLVKDLVKYLKVINKKFVEKNILNKIDLLCWDSGKGIKTIVSSVLNMQNNELVLDVKGHDGNNSYDCSLKVDPSLRNMAKLISLTSTGEMQDKNQKTGNNLVGEDISYDWSVNVKQFPVNLEKSLTFTSRRGHTFVFPSSNIAYVAQNAQEDFDQVGVNCFSVMNVVQYSEKDLVDQKGNVKVYECSVKKGFDDSDQKLMYKLLGDKHFVVEIVDPAWVDFANNISISLN